MLYVFLFQVAPPLFALWLFLRWDSSQGFRRFSLPILFCGGSLLQAWLWWECIPSLDNPDSHSFYNLAHGLETDLRSILYRPKLYPLFLGLFPGLKAVLFAQCVLKLGMGYFLIRMGWLLQLRSGVLAWMLFLFLFNSLWLYEPLRIMDTTLFAFLLTAFLMLGLMTLTNFSTANFPAMCVMGWCLSLTRQVADIGLLLAFGFLLFHYRNRPHSRWVFPVGLVLGLAVAGSGALNNGLRYGVWQRSVALGVNLYTHLSFYELSDLHSPEWDFVSAYLPEEKNQAGTWITDFHQDLPWPIIALPHRLERAMGSKGSTDILLHDRKLTGRFFQWMNENPRTYLASVGNEFARLGLKAEEMYPRSLISGFISVPIGLVRFERGIIHQAPYLLIVFGLLGFIRKRPEPEMIFLALAAFGYLFLIPFIHLGFTRYALPALPALLLWAGFGLQHFQSNKSC